MRGVVVVLALVFALALAFTGATWPTRANPWISPRSRAHPASLDGDMPALAGATGWLNSPPLVPADVRGKVVVVQFWTYTCINWLRAHPHVRAWAERYRDRGLVVIGVHSPEFPFEREVDNVRRAARDLRVDYPIAVDNDFAVWRAFHNQYWPALYVFDAKGRLRHQHFGEGEYEATERVLQELLAEAGAGTIDRRLSVPDARGVEAAADWTNVGSPEIYVGQARAPGFASPEPAARNARRVYTLPARFHRNQWAVSGDWTFAGHAARLNAPGGRIVIRFHARDVHLVIGAASAVRFRLLLDGRPPGAAGGLDVDAEGNGVIREPRLYQLIRQVGPISERELVIELLDNNGAEVFAFTFG